MYEDTSGLTVGDGVTRTGKVRLLSHSLTRQAPSSYVTLYAVELACMSAVLILAVHPMHLQKGIMAHLAGHCCMLSKHTGHSFTEIRTHHTDLTLSAV